MKMIPNELAAKFDTVEGRKKLIELFADSDTMFSGVNVDGESVTLSIAADGMILKTEQKNGWVRVNYYDSEGEGTGESFDGKWNEGEAKVDVECRFLDTDDE